VKNFIAFFYWKEKVKFEYLVLDTIFVYCYNLSAFGRLTQLGECNPYKVEVAGSSPASPTKTVTFGGVVQLVRTLACHARGREFESRHSRHNRKRLFGFNRKAFFLFLLQSK
jgi:hypothetical protein